MNFIGTLLSGFFVKLALVVGVSGFVFIKALSIAISALTGIAVH